MVLATRTVCCISSCTCDDWAFHMGEKSSLVLKVRIHMYNPRTIENSALITIR